MIDSVSLNVMENLEKTSKQFWNISHATGNFLNMLIKISGSKNALEIGTSNGYSGIWLGKALKETGGKLKTIEFYNERLDVAKENFKICNVADIITPVQGSACMILEYLEENEKFDFVFVDANKSEYIKYFDLLKNHFAEHAVLACDNITSHAEKVKPFVDKISADDDWQVEILDLPAGLLVARRNN